MERLIYLLDTNVLADYVNGSVRVVNALDDAIDHGDRVCVCPPVHYELLRGLIRTNATRKRMVFEDILLPTLDWVDLDNADWRRATQLWADAVSRGKQLSDIDLLIAALAIRLDAVIVSADADFDALPVKRVNWRKGDSAP